MHGNGIADELGDDFLGTAAAVGLGASVSRVRGRDVSGLADHSVGVAEFVASHLGRKDVHRLEEFRQLNGLGAVDRDLLPLVLSDEIADEDDLFPRPVWSSPPAVRHEANGNQLRIAKLPNAMCGAQGRPI